jgi:hypothetical protein
VVDLSPWAGRVGPRGSRDAYLFDLPANLEAFFSDVGAIIEGLMARFPTLVI